VTCPLQKNIERQEHVWITIEGSSLEPRRLTETIVTRCSRQDVANAKFAHVTYTEAVDILLKAKKKFEFPVTWGADLQSEHERYLTEVAFKGRPLIVTDYPKVGKSTAVSLSFSKTFEKVICESERQDPFTNLGGFCGRRMMDETLTPFASRVQF
jgi:hypothetical protein